MTSRLHGRALVAADREAGAVGAEYAGAIVIVVLLIGSLLVGFGAGGPVSEQVKYVICQALTFGQGGCQAPGSATEEPGRPTEPCVLSRTIDDRSAGLSVMFVAVEGGGMIRVEEMSDGTWRVSAEGTAGIGLTESAGAGVSVTVDDSTYGIDARAGMSAYVDGAAGVTWVVDDEGTKDALVDHLQGERDKTTLSALGPAGSVVAGGMELWEWLSGERYDPGEPNEVYVEAGISGNANATGSGLVVSGSGNADGAVALGYSFDMDDGTVTQYFTYDLALDGGVAYDDVVGRAELGGSASTEVLLALTLDPDGNPLQLDVQGQAVGDWKAQVTDLFAGGEPTGPSGNGGYLYSASMDLTRDELSSIGEDLLHASGILPGPEDPRRQLESAADAAATFIDAARERGVLTRQELSGDSTTPFAIQGGGDVGPVGLGGSFANSTTTVTTESAEYFSEGLWREWVECS